MKKQPNYFEHQDYITAQKRRVDFKDWVREFDGDIADFDYQKALEELIEEKKEESFNELLKGLKNGEFKSNL